MLYYCWLKAQTWLDVAVGIHCYVKFTVFRIRCGRNFKRNNNNSNDTGNNNHRHPCMCRLVINHPINPSVKFYYLYVICLQELLFMCSKFLFCAKGLLRHSGCAVSTQPFA